MYSLEIENEKVIKFLNSKPELINAINKEAEILDQCGAPKEQRYQKVMEYMAQINGDGIIVHAYEGIIFYILITVFGLSQHLYQIGRQHYIELFANLKNYRNHGIKEHNNYHREITDKKIQDQLEKNFDCYIKQNSTDKESKLLLDLEYLEKYRKLNSIGVPRNNADNLPTHDDILSNNTENRKAYETALLKIRF